MGILGTQTAQKMATLGHFRPILKQRSATCESHSQPPPLSFLLKLCVIVLHTHRYHPPKSQPNPEQRNGVLFFANSIAFGKSTSQRIYREQHTPKIGWKLHEYRLKHALHTLDDHFR